MELSLTFDRGDQHHCPWERSVNEAGVLTGGLKQVVAFDLKCLFPDGSCDPLTAFDDGVGS